MDKSDLTLINTKPEAQMPAEALVEFKKAVIDDGTKPSKALRDLMKKYDCAKPDAHLVLKMVETAYPDIDVSRKGFRSNLVDGGYPGVTVDFSDDDFDKGIAQIKDLPASW